MAATLRSTLFRRSNTVSKLFCSSYVQQNVRATSRLLSTLKIQRLPNIEHQNTRWPSILTTRGLSTEAEAEKSEVSEDFHSLITDKERSKGPAAKYEFQAETRKLLDIVAKSLYSEREVFIRELISNASDALEKLRYLQMTGVEIVEAERPLEIHIATDDDKKTFTIQDTGLGMDKDELIGNLGTIAQSGSKSFLEDLEDKENKDINRNLIGQFGVGFYSAFMVGEKIDVYTQSHKPDNPSFKWTSDGLGTYELSEAEGVQRGTKIVVHLRGDCYDYAKEDFIKDIIKKYSNFVGVPIYVNGTKVNKLEAIWMAEPRDVTEDMHEEFYRFISNAFDKPQYTLHYKTDAPLNLRALFYVPDYKPTIFDLSQQTDSSVSLYSRKVMIMPKAKDVLPKWLRFLKGVVDSEDIPLNLSRELLQDSAVIRKIRWVLTNRLLKFFREKSKKDPEAYLKFFENYGMFFREGIVTTNEQEVREEISRLLRFESSKLNPGEMTSLDEYTSRMEAGSRNIYYLSAPNRQLAETSPYFEAMQKKDIEVLFLYEHYDELVLMNLAQFDKKNLKSIENELVDDTSAPTTEASTEGLKQDEADDLLGWLQVTLGNRVAKTKITRRLASHPCLITVQEMGSARHFLRTALADKKEEEKYRLLQPTLEINPEHAIIKKMYSLKESDPDLARLLAEQLYDNAMIAAGLMDDPRSMLNRLNDILTRTLEKH